MQKIQNYIRFVEILSISIVTIYSLYAIYFWIGNDIGIFKYFYHDIDLHFSNTSKLTFFQRFFGLFIQSISLIILCLGLYNFISLLKCFKKGEIFSSQTTKLLNNLTMLSFIWAIYSFFQKGFLSTIYSLSNPPGQRIFSLSFGSDEIINIFLFGLLMIITYIMQKGSTLKNEQDLTI